MSIDIEEEKKALKAGDKKTDAGDPKKAADERRAAQVGVEGLFADKKEGRDEDEEKREAEEIRRYYEEYRKQEEIFERNRDSYEASYILNDEDTERLAEQVDAESRKRDWAYDRNTEKIVEQLRRTQGGKEALQLLLNLGERSTGSIPEEVTEKISSSQSGKEAANIIKEWRGNYTSNIRQQREIGRASCRERV